jgi:hypothetical protein
LLLILDFPLKPLHKPPSLLLQLPANLLSLRLLRLLGLLGPFLYQKSFARGGGYGYTSHG